MTPNDKTKNSFKSVRVSAASSVRAFFVYLGNEVLIFLALRPRRVFWGKVYDSITKEPLDPAIVKLAYVDKSKGVETVITDMHGRYGFLVQPGKFKILARKSNYVFPSFRVTGNSDGVYDHLYHGEFMEVVGESEVVAPNIPMDPVAFDWNQQAKRSVIHERPYLKKLLRFIVACIFWSGFAYTLYVFLAKPQPFAWGYGLYIVGLYALFFLAALFLPEPIYWGTLEDAQSGLPVSGVEVSLHNPVLPQVLLGKTKVPVGGRFLLLANPGKYIVQVHDITPEGRFLVGEEHLRVFGDGVVNRTIKITVENAVIG